MDNKKIVIKATAENIDKEKGNIDEIKLMQSNGNACKAVFGKHGTGTVLSLADNKVVAGTNSKFLWTTGKVEVADSANTKIEVNKKGSRYTFEAKDNENYNITVTHRLNLLLIIILGIILVALIIGAMIEFNKLVIEDKSLVGDFSVGDKQEQVIDEKTQEEVPTISYAGYSKYTVSEKNTDIEMYNPDNNFVDMYKSASKDIDRYDIISVSVKLFDIFFVYII